MLNAVHVQDMVEVIRREMEQEKSRHDMMAMAGKPSIMARSRKSVGGSIVAAGKLIQGRTKRKRAVDPGSHPFKPAHSAK